MLKKLNTQVGDQSLKGLILGGLVSLLANSSLDPNAQGAVVTLVAAALAWLSTKTGNKSIASFLDR